MQSPTEREPIVPSSTEALAGVGASGGVTDTLQDVATAQEGDRMAYLEEEAAAVGQVGQKIWVLRVLSQPF